MRLLLARRIPRLLRNSSRRSASIATRAIATYQLGSRTPKMSSSSSNRFKASCTSIWWERFCSRRTKRHRRSSSRCSGRRAWKLGARHSWSSAVKRPSRLDLSKQSSSIDHSSSALRNRNLSAVRCCAAITKFFFNLSASHELIPSGISFWSGIDHQPSPN